MILYWGFLEATRFFFENVPAFARLETLFPDLSEAAYGANCYNFLR
jgi:hypothetical protein